MAEIIYGIWEGWPTVYVDASTAWCYHHDRWHAANPADVATKATMLSKITFDRHFGHLPTIPDHAAGK
jgi:hypothetical protein